MKTARDTFYTNFIGTVRCIIIHIIMVTFKCTRTYSTPTRPYVPYDIRISFAYFCIFVRYYVGCIHFIRTLQHVYMEVRSYNRRWMWVFRIEIEREREWEKKYACEVTMEKLTKYFAIQNETFFAYLSHKTRVLQFRIYRYTQAVHCMNA